VFGADTALFQTGWFVESLATQVLVIFVIRTRGNPLRSRPHRLLVVAAVTVVSVGIALPYTPAGEWFGFVPLPFTFLLALGAMAVAYLLLAESVKRWFYRRLPPRGTPRAPVIRPPFPLTGRQ
jgi:P-type Mg2+ transporter